MNDYRKSRPRGITRFTIWLVLLGVFALISSLYLCGNGFLWLFPRGVDYILPLSDLLVTVPAILVAATGL